MITRVQNQEVLHYTHYHKSCLLTNYSFNTTNFRFVVLKNLLLFALKLLVYVNIHVQKWVLSSYRTIFVLTPFYSCICTFGTCDLNILDTLRSI